MASAEQLLELVYGQRWNLLAWAKRWCAKCGLSATDSGEDIFNDAIVKLLEEPPGAVTDPILYVRRKIRQLACNKSRRHLLTPYAEAAITIAEEKRTPVQPDDLAADRQVAERIMAILFSLAGVQDGDVTLVLMAMQDGHQKREDIMAETGLTARQYRVARETLSKLLEQLPEDLKKESVLRGRWE